MKVIMCCPNCGYENLELTSPNNAKWFKCLKCKEKFHIQRSGYNIKEIEKELEIEDYVFEKHTIV